MKVNKHRAVLEIGSWQSSINGEHYYGRLFCEGIRNVRLEHEVTEEYAKQLNDKEGHIQYKAGDFTERFVTREQVIKTGIEQALKAQPDTKFIIAGSCAVGNPQEVVWCVDEELRTKLNIIWEEEEGYYRESSDPYKLHEKRMEEMQDEWDGLLSKAFLKDGE